MLDARRRRRAARARASTSASRPGAADRGSVICDPTWLCRPTISTPWQTASAPRELTRRRRCAMPNLLRLQPGGDVRMAARVDVRVHAQRDPRARLALARQRVDPLELALRLRVDRLDAEIDRLRELGGRLADAGEHDLRRNESGAQRDVDLAAGIRVGVAAEAAQQPRDRQRRVGFQRVVDRVRIATRTPRRSPGSAPRSSLRCRRSSGVPSAAASSASGTPSHASVPSVGGIRSRMYQVHHGGVADHCGTALAGRWPGTKARCEDITINHDACLLILAAAQPATPDSLIEQCLSGDQVGVGD